MSDANDDERRMPAARIPCSITSAARLSIVRKSSGGQFTSPVGISKVAHVLGWFAKYRQAAAPEADDVAPPAADDDGAVN